MDWIYVGMTTNLSERLERHNSGRNTSTKHYKPFVLLYTELFDTSKEARNREKYLKTTSGKRWIRQQFLH